MSNEDIIEFLQEYGITVRMSNFLWTVILYSGQEYTGRSYLEALECAYWDIKGHP